jgi:hypothetical protein
MVKHLNKKCVIAGKMLIILGLAAALCLSAVTSLAHAQSYHDQTIFADPPSINASSADVGTTITVKINISDALNLWSAQVGLKFNPNVLNCTALEIGEFWTRQGSSYLWMPGTIDNALGEVSISGMSFQAPATPQNGSGTLMTANFTVKAEGISDIHLLNVKTNTKVGTTVTVTPCRVRDVYTLTANSDVGVITILHNATGVTTSPPAGIPSLAVNQAEVYLTYNLTAKSYQSGETMNVYCNVTIPKAFMWDISEVLVDDTSVSSTIVDDADNTYVYFTIPYTDTAATKNVKIVGGGVIPEYPTTLILLIMAALTTIILLTPRKLWKTKLYKPL